jgi:serine/threonine-protein kinase
MLPISDLVGHTIGEYKLVELIGSGVMATVFKAYQVALDRWVAIKILHSKEEDALFRFQREARAVALLRHRNILIVYEYGEEGDWPYIVMEYVQGGTLAESLAKNRIEWPRAVNLIIPVAEALQYAHQQNIIHRDVKPSNILLPEPDWPLLADFGLVKVPTRPGEIATRSGTSLGTPAYIAPEQARGVVVDHRADIYSLGVVLFEMIAGRIPFNHSNPNKLMLAHISEPAPSPRDFNPECPASLEEIILRALQKLPSERYKDMAEMIAALEKVALSYKTPPVISAQAAVQPPPDQAATPARLAAQLLLTDRNVSLRLPDKDRVIIGRSHRDMIADVDLGPYEAAQLGISRHHARLTWRRPHWFIDDLGSLNGTFVNDVQVKPGNPVPLYNGDVIRCSHMNFVFVLPAAID